MIQASFRRRFFGVLVALTMATVPRAQADDSVLIGALRWDNWTAQSTELKVVEQPEWKNRVPFFAQRGEDGRLAIAGDLENVLSAEVAYAYSAGIDYFVFGFYPETTAWGRNTSESVSLNRALETYLQLPDRRGVRFAISLNQSFPQQDVDDISKSIGSFVSNKDYVRTPSGVAPIFVFSKGWSGVYGSDEAAKQVVQRIKDTVYKQSGVKLLFILEYPDPAAAAEQARKSGMDMTTAYATFAPGQPGAHAFKDCVANSSAYWQRSTKANFPFIPNVTLGWDPRPRDSIRLGEGKDAQVKTWCGAAHKEDVSTLVRSAMQLAATGGASAQFRSVLVYAWNEFTEGGWLAPTWTDGLANLEAFRAATGRKRTLAQVDLTWPEMSTGNQCPVRTGDRQRNEVVRSCPSKISATGAPPWPCPPGTVASSQRVRAPTGLETLYWPGLWTEQSCRGG